MAITKTKIQSSLNKAVFKITATAAADTTTLTLKDTFTIGAGNSVFTAATNTISRAAADWISSDVTVGSILIVAGTVNNNGTFIVKSVTTTDVVIETTIAGVKNVIVDEAAVAATYTGSYKSDFLHYGQIFTDASPKVNIAEVSYSTANTGFITITRNSVVTHKLFGSDSNFHAPSNEQSDQNIAVLFDTTAGGTLMIELSKVEGFGALNPYGVQ
jgi:hypothetical protein